MLLRALIIGTLLSAAALAQPGPFEGYGKNTTGGTNIVTVTNTNDSGAGSLRAAVVTGNWIKFSVSGTINCLSNANVPSNVTIDGKTSPTGIYINGAGCANNCLTVTGSNVIIQGIKVRGCGNDNIGIFAASGSGDITNIVIDQVESDAAGDGNLDITASGETGPPYTSLHEVTVSNSILANNVNPGASLVAFDAYHITFHHNLFVNNVVGDSRVPKCVAGGDYNALGHAIISADLGVICDVRYNVMSKWLIGVLPSNDGWTTVKMNVFANYFDAQDIDHSANAISNVGTDALTQVYVAGNVSVQNKPGVPYYVTPPGIAATAIVNTNDPSNHVYFTVPTVTGPAYNSSTRVTEWQNVINNAGTGFADDSTTTTIRSSVTPPTSSQLAYSWNGPGSSPSASYGRIVVHKLGGGRKN